MIRRFWKATLKLGLDFSKSDKPFFGVNDILGQSNAA